MFLEIRQDVRALYTEANERFRLNLGYYLRYFPENSHPACDPGVFLILQVALRLVNVYDKNVYENPATGSSARAKNFMLSAPIYSLKEGKLTYVCKASESHITCECPREALH